MIYWVIIILGNSDVPDVFKYNKEFEFKSHISQLNKNKSIYMVLKGEIFKTFDDNEYDIHEVFCE